jgi:hypothetical protein
MCRYGHSANIYNDSMYLFGGSNNSSKLNSILKINLENYHVTLILLNNQTENRTFHSSSLF